MGTGAEVVGPVTAAESAKGAAALTASLAPYEVAAGAGALGAGAGAASALTGGMSYAQPAASAFTGLAPTASYAQSALIPGGAFATGAAGGTAAGLAGSELLDAGSFGYGGPEPGVWDKAGSALKSAQATWDGLGTFGQTVAKQVGQAALQGVMGDGGEGTRRPTTSFEATQAVPMRAQGLYGSSGVAVDPTATTNAMSRAAPVAPTGNAQAAPSMPSDQSNSGGNGAVKLGRGTTRQQYT